MSASGTHELARRAGKPFAVDDPLLMARQCLFRFAALTLADPRTECAATLREPTLQRTVEAAGAVVRSEPNCQPSRLGLGERGIAELRPERVFTALPPSDEAYREHFETTFGLLASGPCPPHETEYIQEKLSFQRSQALADVAGFYRAFGLTTNRQFPERPDHVALELEFMAHLFEMEVRAARGSNEVAGERAMICRLARERFFREHVVWWMPALGRLLTVEDAGGFYGEAGRFLAALITAERSLAGLPCPQRGAIPSMTEPPEACSGCLLGQEG